MGGDLGELQSRNSLQYNVAGRCASVGCWSSTGCRNALNSNHAIVGERLTIGQGDSSLPGVGRIIFQRPTFQTGRFNAGHFQLRRHLGDHFVDGPTKHTDARITFPAQCFLLNRDSPIGSDKNQNLRFRFLLLHNPAQSHIGSSTDRDNVSRNSVCCSRAFKFQIVDE